MASIATPLALDIAIETIPLTQPFRISGYTFDDAPVVVVSLGAGPHDGRGEASGVYYFNETPDSMKAAIEAQRDLLEAGPTRDELRAAMPIGGARNAVDCALWELEAKRQGRPAWQLAGIETPRPLVTTFTLGADDPARMVAAAAEFGHARALKLKLTGGDVALDAERVRAVRAAYPDVWIAVDANQGFTPDSYHELLPRLIEARVSLVEQPFARGREADMDGLASPIPVAADESVQGLDEVEGLVGRFDIVNIKLDKCGGLTEALLMARRARALGLGVMVGNMVGTSLAMAPAFIVGQLCDIVDLDGPIYMASDRVPGVVYADGLIDCPDEVWGGSRAVAAAPGGRREA